MDDASLSDLDYAYLTTKGRVSGLPREIEIWFVLSGGRVYFLAGGGRRANWVRNLLADPQVRLRIGDGSWSGKAQVVTDPDEDARVRRLMLEKYRPRYSGGLGKWARTGLPVAVDRLEAEGNSTGRT